MVSGETLKAHQAYYKGDSRGWQQQARLLQSLWRERHGLQPESDALHAGSMLADVPRYKVAGSAFVSADAVRAAKKAARIAKIEGAVMQPTRLWRNLLSSQPLCMNLFGPLSENHNDPRVSLALSRVWPDIRTVTGIRYEWSPGRRDPRFLGNGTAFDVYLEYTATDGSPRFLGIEVKYHEDLGVAPPSCAGRPQEVFETSGVFAADSFPVMSTGKNAQILLDHLLALSINAATEFAREGAFVLLYPELNTAVSDVIDGYRTHLVDQSTFITTTLEDVVAALAEEFDEPWVKEFRNRYLDVSAIERLESKGA